VSSPDADVVVGRWRDGRIGTVRALRPYSGYGAVAFRPKGVVQSNEKMATGYGPLLKEIAKFFETRVAPVPNEETLEIFAFMDAAQRSKETGGRPARLPAVGDAGLQRHNLLALPVEVQAPVLQVGLDRQQWRQD